MKNTISTLRWSLPIVAVFAAVACSDLASVPDRVPDSLVIEPADTLILQGDLAPLRVTVLDEDGNPFQPLPSWAPPVWSFSDPTAVGVAPDGISLEGLGGGEVWVRANLAGLKAQAKLRVNPTSVDLSAPVIYLVQSVQNPQFTVPLIAGKPALLRVFVASQPASFYQPRVEATFYLDGDEVHRVSMHPGGYLIPDELMEGRFDRSFNAAIPASVIQPGLEVVVELDVDGVTPLSAGSQVRIPAQGRKALDVRDMPPFELTVVPVLHADYMDQGVFNFVNGLTEDSPTIRYLKSVLPIGDLDLEIRDTYTTTADLTTDAGWSGFLREITTLRAVDGSDRYYYGALVLPPGSKWGGLASIGRPYSVGRNSSSTFAHELGHNLNLRHAPCGNAGGPDPNYPYTAGSIGMWGYEHNLGIGLGSLKDPDHYNDLMGYCGNRWISDYHFNRAMSFRFETEGAPAQPTPEAEQVLLLWGSAGEKEMLLEPSFVATAPPSLPKADGPYQLEGFGRNGRTLFSLSFTPEEVVWGGTQFNFAVPLATEAIEALDVITLSGPVGGVTVDRSTRLPRMVLATDESTGRIRGIYRNGAVPEGLGPSAIVTVSEGLPPAGQIGMRE